MQFGHLELFLIRDGTFRLDGGAMFGQVPKVLWEKSHPADERNRILLGLNCLLVRTPDETILIDTGLGDMHDEKFAYLYAVDKSVHSLEADLATVGVGPEQVDKVILSHLHFDHCGGNCRRRDGRVVATFPNATYHVNRGEYETAKNPDSRSRPSYQPHTWEVLEQTDRLVVTEDNDALAPGVELLATPGHTLHHQSVLLHSEGQTACFLADVAATSTHLKANWVMGFDLYPLLTMQSRERVLKQAAAEGWLLFFEHAADILSGVLDAEGNLTPFEGI